jgi:hypothetical protein
MSVEEECVWTNALREVLSPNTAPCTKSLFASLGYIDPHYSALDFKIAAIFRQ